MGAFAQDWTAMSAISRQPSRQPDPAAESRNKGTAKRVWLLLYTEGGLWSVTELRDRLRLDRELRTALTEMVDRGLIVRRKATDIDGKETVQYSVTRKCKVPRGVAIEEIETLLRMALQVRQ